MYKTIKKFLAKGGKCLLIENGKPIGVVLTVEEYEKLHSEIKEEVSAVKPVETIASPPKADQPWAGAKIADIEAADDITLEDLGLDELPY